MSASVSTSIGATTNNFNYYSINRNTIYKKATTGFQLRLGVPLTEFVVRRALYLNFDDVSLNHTQFHRPADPPASSNATAARRALSVRGRGQADQLDPRRLAGLRFARQPRPSHPRQDRFVRAGAGGLGGSVKYAWLRTNAARYWPVGKFIFSITGEAGVIQPLSHRNVANSDDVLLTDRFYLGEPQIRGFDIRGWARA